MIHMKLHKKKEEMDAKKQAELEQQELRDRLADQLAPGAAEAMQRQQHPLIKSAQALG